MKWITVLLILAMAGEALAQSRPANFLYAKRDGGGAISELVSMPESVNIADLSGYEVLDARDPDVLRYLDSSYSFKAAIKQQFVDDPALRVLFEWIRLKTGLTRAQAIAELEVIAEGIQPDP
jgi:hypothetical protein